eukprot:2340574-Heterocapsa_arctica.AAC.1
MAWLVKSESQLSMVNSTPMKAHELWMDTNSLARYLTINAGIKHRTGYSPATLTGKLQTEGVRARNRRAKPQMVKNPLPPRTQQSYRIIQ